ncbi:Uncharacterised protein [Shewanella putrefaciens]|nr:Uncharacterised protein [Shewanella putrefaciens]
MNYPYANCDLLATPQHYQYSQYMGVEFVAAWKAMRQALLVSLPPPALSLHPTSDLDMTHSILWQYCRARRMGEDSSSNQEYWIAVLVKKFEVSKRLCRQYSDIHPHKVIDKTDYLAIPPYLLLAEALIHQCRILLKSNLLSCLLKLCDTLSTQVLRMSPEERSQFAWVLLNEQELLTLADSRLSNVD